MYKCKYCGKEFKKSQSLSAHYSHCKLNPNYNEEKDNARQSKRNSIRIFNKEKEEQTRKERILICKHCGKEYLLNLTDKEFNSGKYSKFCSRSCANSRGPRSQEIKDKISKTINNGIKNHKYELKNQYGIYEYGDIQFRTLKKYICEYCGKEFESYKKKRFCSRECSNKSMKEKVSQKIQERIKNGTFQGWKSRNITSYAEKFWKQVLDNNNIHYIREKVFEYGNSGKGERYFLDFYIEINNRKIDLEIDGKQHKYEDRKEKDIIRDQYIKESGIEIYRIDWNEINSKQGSNLMKEKIDKFLEFIK